MRNFCACTPGTGMSASVLQLGCQIFAAPSGVTQAPFFTRRKLLDRVAVGDYLWYLGAV